MNKSASLKNNRKWVSPRTQVQLHNKPESIKLKHNTSVKVSVLLVYANDTSIMLLWQVSQGCANQT